LHAGQLFIVALGAPLHPDAKATGEKEEDCQATGEKHHHTTEGEMGVKGELVNGQS
jgi:hypothetical protein